MQADRPNNPLAGQPLVFNQDCHDVNYAADAAGEGERQVFIRDWYRRAFAAGAGVFVADVTLSDVVQTIDTPTGELFGARFGEEERSGIPRWRTIVELRDQGTDVLHLACEEGRRAGALVLAGMRMSDAHHGRSWQAAVEADSPLLSQFIKDHPEWANTWPDGSLDATLNYAVPEVQAHQLQILRELATNYEVDGLELNWMRWCRHFPAGRQREHLADLTHFVQQARSMLDEVAAQKGVARLVLGHRIPVTLEECLNIGCDVRSWVQQGYADFLAPMDFLLNDLNLRTDEFVRAAEGTECLVYPGFGTTKYSFGHIAVGYDDRQDPDRVVMMRSLDQFRATAANWYAWGAAGGSCFNMYLWPAEHQEFYTQAIAILSDPARALAGPRYYVYLPVWKDGGNPTGRPNAQSLTLGVGQREVFHFRMADGKYGEQLQGILRFRIYEGLPGDEYQVELNGQIIPAGNLRIVHQPQGEAFEPPEEPVRLSGGSFVWPANLCFEVALEDCPPFAGDNELAVTLVNLAPRWNLMVDVGPDKPRVLEAIEVRVSG